MRLSASTRSRPHTNFTNMDANNEEDALGSSRSSRFLCFHLIPCSPPENEKKDGRTKKARKWKDLYLTFDLVSRSAGTLSVALDSALMKIEPPAAFNSLQAPMGLLRVENMRFHAECIWTCCQWTPFWRPRVSQKLRLELHVVVFYSHMRREVAGSFLWGNKER